MIPLLSVAIATKNREEFCIKAIQSILDLNDVRIEIAVSDNSDSRLISEYVKKMNSSQIKYRFLEEKISFIDNFNYALELCTGDYVTMIGDDDTILASMIHAAEWMKKNDIDTVAPQKSQRYFWPKSRPQSPNGTVDLFNFTNAFEKIDAQKELIKAAKEGIYFFFMYKVAKSYHGLVKRSLMEKVKEITGNYYGAISPDIFAAVTLSYLSKKHYYIDYPLSIMGVCRDSGSAQQINGEHVGRLEDMPHLKHSQGYQWDHRVPKYYCVTNTWAESGVKALEMVGAKDVLKQLNIYPIIAMGILMNRKFIFKIAVDESEKLRKRLNIPFLKFWFNTIASGISLSIEKLGRIIKHYKNPEFIALEGITEIGKAQKICEEKLDMNFFVNK